MILYNVTVKIDLQVEKDWLEWMRNEHIPEVVATGMFSDARIMKLLGYDDREGITYAVQYSCPSMADLKTYQKEYAKDLQAKHTERYKDQYVAFRTLMEEVWTSGESD